MGSTLEADVRINGQPPVKGELVIERDVQFVESMTATKPDLSWEHTDQQGHYHAYGIRQDAELPTLDTRTEHVDCDSVHVAGFAYDEDDDEPCEGYDVTKYVCRICHEEVEPRRIPDSGTVAIPGMWSWTVTLRAAVQAREVVSLRMRTAAGEFFGVAESAGVVSMSAMGEVTAKLFGAGPLGQRDVPQKCTCPLIDTSAAGGPPSFARGASDGRCPVHRDRGREAEIAAAKRVARGEVPDPFYEA